LLCFRSPFPQGQKPYRFSISIGTAEAVPFPQPLKKNP
jgi:hypothetical protein